MMKKNNKITKPNIWEYFKEHTAIICLYVFLILFGGLCMTAMAIISAEAIELLTVKLYDKAIMLALIGIGIIIFQRSCWFGASWIYNVVSIKIVAKINSNLSNQAFKLNSRTYTNHDTGTFITRLRQRQTTACICAVQSFTPTTRV